MDNGNIVANVNYQSGEYSNRRWKLYVIRSFVVCKNHRKET